MNKKYLYLAAAAAALFFGWKWWQKRKAAKAGQIASPVTAPGANAKAAGAAG